MFDILLSLLNIFWSLLQCAVIIWLPMVAGDNGGGVSKFLRLPGCDIAIWPSKLGPNKTWTAYPTGIFLAIGVQKLEGWYFDLEVGSYHTAAALGFGAVLGDHVKSFFKRHKRIAPGAPWYPWDQIDYAVGGCVLYLLVFPTMEPRLLSQVIVPLLVVGLALVTKPIGNRVSYYMGLRTTPH